MKALFVRPAATRSSAPDGCTLFAEALPFTVIRSLFRTSFDVTKNFAGIKAD